MRFTAEGYGDLTLRFVETLHEVAIKQACRLGGAQNRLWQQDCRIIYSGGFPRTSRLKGAQVHTGDLRDNAAVEVASIDPCQSVSTVKHPGDV